MTPKAQAVADLILLAEAVPQVLRKIARTQEDRLERMGAMQERLEVWMLEKKAEAFTEKDYEVSTGEKVTTDKLKPVPKGYPEALKKILMRKGDKKAAAEGLGPAQDPQNVAPTEPAAPAPQKTLQELMGTPDVQKWFRGSVGGLAKRGNIPYALLSPDQEPQTNMEHEQLKAILQKYLEAKAP